MKKMISKVAGVFLGVVLALALFLLSDTRLVYADEQQMAQLVVKLNDQVVAENSTTNVTPGVGYTLSVFKAEDMTTPQPGIVGQVTDELGNPVVSQLLANQTHTSFTIVPAKEDAGKTLKISFRLKDAAPVVATVQLKVNYIAESIKLSKSSYTMNIKDTFKLTATVAPNDAINNEVVWESENTKVATVKNGVVTAIAPGKCSIKAILKDGTLSAICQIVVRKPSLNYTSKVIAKGVKLTLKVLNTNETVKWKTSNQAIATVSKGVVTAKKTGTVTITAITGGYTLTCKVKVTNPEIVNSKGESVEGISVTSGFARILKVSGGSGTVLWKSSNTKIATVDKGVVRGLKNGSCYVYALINGKTLKCKVTTKANIFTTTPTKNGRYLKKGKIHLSNASIYYSNGKLIYKCYAVNSTTYKKIQKFNNLTVSIYVNNQLIAKQSYKNINLNLSKYKSKALAFTLNLKNPKMKADLRAGKIQVKYSYNYQFLN